MGTASRAVENIRDGPGPAPGTAACGWESVGDMDVLVAMVEYREGLYMLVFGNAPGESSCHRSWAGSMPRHCSSCNASWWMVLWPIGLLPTDEPNGEEACPTGGVVAPSVVGSEQVSTAPNTGTQKWVMPYLGSRHRESLPEGAAERSGRQSVPGNATLDC